MKKKILIVVNSLSFFITHRIEIASAAKNTGYDVKVFYGELGNADTKVLTKMGIDYFHLPFNRKSINPLRELWYLISFILVFYKYKPDIVHLITIKAYLYGGIAARLTNIPCVLSAIAGLGFLFNQKYFFNKIIIKLLYPFFSYALNHPNQKIIVQNKDDKKKIINWLGLNENKVVLFRGSGVNLSKFINLDYSSDIITVCFASRLLRDKGVMDYVSAAKLIYNRGFKVKFLLAGDLDPGNPTSLKESDLLKIKKDKIIQLLGYQRDIPSLFARSHIICLPSYGEGLPKTLVEAAAASRAIITTNSPGCRDAIIPNKTGLIVPEKNPEKLADALQWLIENPKKIIAMGKEGRKLAEKEYPIEKIIQKHLSIYKNLLDSSS